MFLKRLFYASASILMLAFSWQIGQRAVAATGPGGPTEVVTLSGTATDGEVIPLPNYADGTTAAEADCSWTVSVSEFYNRESTGGGSTLECYTGTGPLQGGRGRYVNCYSFGSGPGQYHTFKVNYLIIATRGSSAPTPARAQSFGSLKAKYR